MVHSVPRGTPWSRNGLASVRVRDVALIALLSCASVACAASKPCPAVPALASHDAAADREALMQTDRDFAKATQEHGADGWASYFADDGAMLPDGRGPITGKEAIRATMARLFANEQRLVWEPARAEVSGDLGYTFGHAKLLARDENGGGSRVVAYLKYLTVWRRQADGSWKIVLDIGNEDSRPDDPSASPIAPPPSGNKPPKDA